MRMIIGAHDVEASSKTAAVIARLESAFFVWIGEDPMSGTPRVTLEHQPGCGGAFTPVRRRSGRAVHDLDLIVTWTPDPLERVGSDPRTHYWAVEWQAVTPFGMQLEDSLADELEGRVGVPTGCYRFSVEGNGYALRSEPFEVEPATLELAAAFEGPDLVIGAHVHAPHGFRLLDMNAWSNRPLPLRAGTTVSALVTPEGEPPLQPQQVVVDAGGEVRLSRVLAPATITIIDRFGNAGTVQVSRP